MLLPGVIYTYNVLAILGAKIGNFGAFFAHFRAFFPHFEHFCPIFAPFLGPKRG